MKSIKPSPNNNVNEKLIGHIKRKLFEKGEVLDHFDVPTDEQFGYFMKATFEIVENQCMSCFFCRNYRSFSLGSMCRIKPDTRDSCFHFSMDIQKVLKKKYYHITLAVAEATGARHITADGVLSSKAKRNVIYESVRLYEMLQCFEEIGIGECGDMYDLEKLEKKFHEFIRKDKFYEDEEIRITQDLLKRQEALYVPFGWMVYFLVIEDERPVIYVRVISRMDLDMICFVDEEGYECYDVFMGDHEDMRRKFRKRQRNVRRHNGLKGIPKSK